jgi:hypothetical protein
LIVLGHNQQRSNSILWCQPLSTLHATSRPEACPAPHLSPEGMQNYVDLPMYTYHYTDTYPCLIMSCAYAPAASPHGTPVCDLPCHALPYHALPVQLCMPRADPRLQARTWGVLCEDQRGGEAGSLWADPGALVCRAVYNILQRTYRVVMDRPNPVPLSGVSRLIQVCWESGVAGTGCWLCVCLTRV